ncbi:MAG: enoyl-CoA hydratase/isomerase family protein [Bacteroidales bacterium]|nr:enoyl-CoA hydratase/isomerase family protein [Bacteroidales bacterium]
MKVLDSNDFYEISIDQSVAVIDIKERVFDLITDVDLSGKLLEFLENIDRNQEIKMLLFFNQPESFDDEQYDRFLYRIMDKNTSRDDCEPPCFCERNIRFREINILNSLIKRIARLQKLVVSGLQGTVVTPFVGAAMVADFRYASENAVFSMIHNKYGLHPSGALPYFLAHFVNHSKALELQMRENILAKEAVELGLINKLLPQQNFKKNLMKEIEPYTKLKYCTIRDTKRLTNFNRKELNDYFDFEAGLLNL